MENRRTSRKLKGSTASTNFNFIAQLRTCYKEKQAYRGIGLAAKRHKLTVKCHYSQALGTQSKLIRKIEVINQKPS